MNNIDKWYAQQCGVRCTREDTPKWYYPDWYPTPEHSGGCHKKFEWSIQDPRCREIIREKFKISTTIWDSSECVSFQMPYDLSNLLDDAHETIAEAEIACLTAIYEARDEQTK